MTRPDAMQRTGLSCAMVPWERRRRLPDAAVDKRIYYHCEDVGESRWDHPLEEYFPFLSHILHDLMPYGKSGVMISAQGFLDFLYNHSGMVVGPTHSAVV